MIKKLLHTPEGVRDIYGEEYQRKLKIEDLLRKSICSYGYEDIQTPTFEYFDVFSKEIGTTPSKDLYKFFDKEGDTLALRPDFTPSVARCVAKYFQDVQEAIRLTYLGNTFINNSNLQGKLKEVTEIGAELMNDDSVSADAEMIQMVIEALKSTGLREFQISIGHMEYFKGICDEVGIDEDNEFLLREYISSKNWYAAEELLKKLTNDKQLIEMILMIAESNGDISVIKNAKKNVTNSRSQKALERLEDVYNVLKMLGNEKYISFDLGILSKYNYYTGIIFKGYTYGIGDVLVKGGRYDHLLEAFGKAKPAIGFMIVIDDLLMALRGQNIQIELKQTITRLYFNEKNRDMKIKEAERLRKEGQNVCLIKEVN